MLAICIKLSVPSCTRAPPDSIVVSSYMYVKFRSVIPSFNAVYYILRGRSLVAHYTTHTPDWNPE